MSYYPYILAGAILLPRWIRRNLLHLGKGPATP